jgi:transposase-like protein
VDTREIAVEYRLAHWAGILRERKESGLSVREYCRQSGYHENVYYYWQRKLRETALAEISSMERPQAAPPSGWALCSTEPKSDIPATSELDQTAALNHLTVEVGGARITVGNEYPVEKLVWLIRGLSKPC